LLLCKAEYQGSVARTTRGVQSYAHLPSRGLIEAIRVAQGMARNSSVEAMQDFAPLLRKSPADLLVMLQIDED
jgi:hypothetical protein